MINLARSVFVVDGPTEIDAFKGKLQKEYGVTVSFRKGTANGRDVSIDKYVELIFPTLVVLLADSFEKIIIILDKEKRKMDAARFAEQVKSKIVNFFVMKKYKKEVIIDKVYVFVPDIMFENWIVADIAVLVKKFNVFKDNISQEQFDGEHGTLILGRAMKTSYKKTTNGPDFFKAIRFEVAKSNSPSFNNFLEFLLA